MAAYFVKQPSDIYCLMYQAFHISFFFSSLRDFVFPFWIAIIANDYWKLDKLGSIRPVLLVIIVFVVQNSHKNEGLTFDLNVDHNIKMIHSLISLMWRRRKCFQAGKRKQLYNPYVETTSYT